MPSPRPVPNARRFALFRPRRLWLPTALGWLVMLGIGGLALGLIVPRLHGLLAVNAPVSGRILIVEGWLSPRALGRALDLFVVGGYAHIVTTGAPIHPHDLHAAYGNYANLAAQTLVGMGLAPERVTAVPAPASDRHRTLHSALAVRRWYAQNDPPRAGIDLLSHDTHARRSWYIFRSVLADMDDVGILALDPWDYDPDRWWHSSSGVRAVLSEALFFVYARWFEPRPAEKLSPTAVYLH